MFALWKRSVSETPLHFKYSAISWCFSWFIYRNKIELGYKFLVMHFRNQNNNPLIYDWYRKCIINFSLETFNILQVNFNDIWLTLTANVNAFSFIKWILVTKKWSYKTQCCVFAHIVYTHCKWIINTQHIGSNDLKSTATFANNRRYTYIILGHFHIQSTTLQ